MNSGLGTEKHGIKNNVLQFFLFNCGKKYVRRKTAMIYAVGKLKTEVIESRRGVGQMNSLHDGCENM